MKLLTILSLSFFATTVFGQNQPDWRVLGRDNMVAVNGRAQNLPPALRPFANSVGMIQPSSCTVTHIGNNVVLTAGHCFNATPQLQVNQPCPEETVQWGFRGNSMGHMTSKCVRILAMQLKTDFDFAVVLLDGAPRDFVSIELGGFPPPGTSVTTLSHPNLGPLRWSPHCRLAMPRGGPASFGGRALYHRCDTNPGSSGAALIDTKTLKIVGIHNGGNDVVNYGTFLKMIPIQEILRRNHLQLPSIQPIK